jgi:ribosomal protein S18 acetylase RimI-like enzyme
LPQGSTGGLRVGVGLGLGVCVCVVVGLGLGLGLGVYVGVGLGLGLGIGVGLGAGFGIGRGLGGGPGHDGGRGSVSARPAAIGAVAFTAGAHIYFAPGRYRPTEPTGQRLLARQLTYVLQQRAGLARNPHGRGMVLVRDPALDAQAEQLGELASRPGVMQAKRLPAARGLFQVKTSMAGPGRQHLELYERGRAVGSADVVLEGPRAKLYNLRVDAEHRGRGGGEELVRAAAVTSERIGKRTLALEADDDGSGKLIRWYQSQGFRPVDESGRGKPAFEAPVRALRKP